MPSGTRAGAAEGAGRIERVVAVVPCYNVGDACLPVVQATRELLSDVIAVDDGSTDDTRRHLERCGVPVLVHGENLGKGAALLTAFRWALAEGFDAVLTLDGDGQHDPSDIPALLSVREREGADIVLGVRQVRLGSAPLRSWIGNALSGAAFSWISRSGIRDCQSGFRIYAASFLSRVLPSLRPGRYETEMDLLLLAVRNGFVTRSVPVRTIYNEQSRRLSHFNPMKDTARVVLSMLKGLAGSSLAAP